MEQVNNQPVRDPACQENPQLWLLHNTEEWSQCAEEIETFESKEDLLFGVQNILHDYDQADGYSVVKLSDMTWLIFEDGEILQIPVRTLRAVAA